MQRRPSLIRVRRAYVSRRRCRCWLVFGLLMVLLICSDVNFIWSLILSGIGLLLLELLVFRC